MIANPKEAYRGPKFRRRYLKFNSYDARQKYNLEEESEIEYIQSVDIEDLLEESQPSKASSPSNEFQSSQNKLDNLIKSIADTATDLNGNDKSTHLNIP